MTTNFTKQLELCQKYIELSANSVKELSKKTYTLRESGTDIPYVSIDGTISPLKSQKNWQWLNISSTDMFSEIKSENGHSSIRISDTSKGLLISILFVQKTETSRIERILFTNRPEISEEETIKIVTGR